MSETVVWIQSKILLQISSGEKPTLVKSASVDLERTGGDWGWCRCQVIEGDTSGSTPLNVKVLADHDKLKDKTMVIPPDVLGGTVCMANEWSSAEALSGTVSSTVPPDDLVNLAHLHEPSVVYCLKRRYEKDLIYTSTGPILIALNPFKALPALYDESKMSDHWLAGEGLAKLDLKPHIYTNAHKAFKNMMQGLELRQLGQLDAICDQSMLVSGESGAGKTVTTKHVMKYLATLSQRKADHSRRRRAASPGRSEPKGPRRTSSLRTSMRTSRALSWKAGSFIEERILQSNPILEAFGNARTVRNDNSSRFGKFIDLQFKQTGSLIGASIDTYLLEKVRLVHQAEGERNFHIFYEMLAAANAEERQEYQLGEYTIKDFKMTNMSGTYDRRDGANDSELFDELVLSMGTMGFHPNIQEDIFAVSAAFLHASNLTFEAPTEESSRIDSSNPHLKPVLKLLGIEEDVFNSALTEYEIDVGNSSYTKQLTVDGAHKALEAFIKGTYGAMFSFIVQTVNKKIDHKPQKGVPTAGKAASIGVLDIFGFESFKFNSFEQLCINYCNEALQQQFNRFVFKTEQEEYKKEGISWEFIEFPDNQDVINLVERKGTGIIPILTDQCRTPRGTDKSFVDALYKQCEKEGRFKGSPLDKGKGQFIIQHYAGPVMYNADGFVEKNKDETPRGASALLEGSTKEFVQLLGKVTAGNEGEAATSRSSKKRPTVGGQFASQLASLRRRIDSTSPHYIRCLKPNQKLVADEFEESMIADQLRYAGVLEAIRVSRLGYSQRYTHHNFVDRYRFIAREAVQAADDNTKVDVLVNEIARQIWSVENPGGAIPADVTTQAGMQKGETKVFLRQKAFDYMEKFRNDCLSSATLVIQSVVRRFLARCMFVRTLKRIIIVQASLRRHRARKIMRAYRQDKNASKVQGFIRMAAARRNLLARKSAAKWLQRHYRGNKGRAYYQRVSDRKKAELAKNDRIYQSAVTIQCMFRTMVARAKVEQAQTLQRKRSKLPVRLEGKSLKIAIQSDRAAAIAKQVAQEKAREVEALNSRLANASNSAEKARLALEELTSVREELNAAIAELEVAHEMTAEANRRADKLEEENKKLKAQIKSGAVDVIDVESVSYDDHPDLKQLDERLLRMKARSKKSKLEVQALVQSLKILGE